MINKLRQSISARLTFALVIIFIAFGVISVTIFVHSSRMYEREVSQTIHSDLAQHIVDEYLLFQGGEPDREAAKKLFHDLMILGPDFEFYLLDKVGSIVSHSSEPSSVLLEKIRLAPIKRYIASQSLEMPLLGEDPKKPGTEKIFSVAPIYQMGEVYGYMYVVIGSQTREQIESDILDDVLMQSGLGLFILVVAVTAIIAAVIVLLITRPLRALTSQVKDVSGEGFDKFKCEQGAIRSVFDQWDASSNNDIDVVGSTLRVLLIRLEEQYQHIVSIDELRKELLSHVSHDLRTPLASLLGYLETWEMQQGQMSEEQSRKFIAVARKNAKRIVVLIEQLFDLANLDSENVTVKKERVAVAELVQDVLQKFALSADEKHIQLQIMPKDSSIEVHADIEKLERVFTNLIENALRHTPKNGAITVNLIRDASLVSVEVSDTGIGIPEEDLPHIFDPHYKAGNSVRENTAHGGLGLAITKKLLELHQADITVKSALDHGTTFRFSLLSA